MPVVSEPITGLTRTYAYGFFSKIPTPYLFLSGIVFLCITIFIRRKRCPTTKVQYHFPPSRPSTPLLEKSDMNIFSYRDETPKLDTDNLALSRTSSSSFDFTTSPSSISSSPKTFSRPRHHLLHATLAPRTSPLLSHPRRWKRLRSPHRNSPRRRSYTKPPNPLTNTPVVNGEIISGDGWRRHTRVFGGGVCEACAESERRMSA
ncbi:hypothetical protein H4I95_06540 [Botrytis cinerea]